MPAQSQNASLCVLIGEDIGPANLERLRRDFPQVDFRFCLDEASFVAAAPAAHIIFSKSFPAAALENSSNLRWVQAGTAGVERLLNAGLPARGVQITNATGAHGVPISELILSMMLAFASGINLLIRGQAARAHLRDTVLHTKFELAGQTLCVIGLGDIGGTLATKAAALDMHVIGVRRQQTPTPGVTTLFPPERLHEALAQADHVALCLPLTSATHHLIGRAELRAMPAHAYIYNVGRGGSIDPDALLVALQAGEIAGAGLDVTEPEPLSPTSPLWEMPNVILSQHTSGMSPHNADRITRIFADNLRRFIDGQPLANRIDPQRGY